MASIGGAQRAFRLLRALKTRLGADDDKKVQDRRELEEIVDMLGESGEFLFRFFPPRRLHHFITCTNTINQGAFGVVSFGKPTRLGLRRMPRLKEGRTYAVRCTDARSMSSCQASILSLSRERILEYIGIMTAPACAEANIIRCFAFMVEVPRGRYYEVMELLEGPDLHGYLACRSRTVPEEIAADLARQIFTALDYLHRQAGVLHRDVKPENFGFERPVPASDLAKLPTLRLFDFGLAWALPKAVDDASSRDVFSMPLAGTPLYLAPECWARRCGPSSDVWGAGIIAYMMLSLDMPFDLVASVDMVEYALKQKSLEFPEDRWADVSGDARSLVAGTLEREPRRRLSTAEALASRWLSHPPTAGLPAAGASACERGAAVRATWAPAPGRKSTAWCPSAGKSAWASRSNKRKRGR